MVSRLPAQEPAESTRLASPVFRFILLVVLASWTGVARAAESPVHIATASRCSWTRSSSRPTRHATAPAPAAARRRGAHRLGGFAPVNAPFAGGEFATRPLTFTGRRLVLDYSTSVAGSV